MIDLNNLPELPKGWECPTLGNVTNSIKGKKPLILGDKSEDLTVPYINIEAFEKRIVRQFTSDTNCPKCNSSDILIVWDGARFGLVGKGVSGVIGSTLAKLVFKEIKPLYIYYFIFSKFDVINSRPKGVGIPHLDPNYFWSLFFPLPPLSEQQRIVNKIEELFTRLDAGVEALKKIQLQLKRYRQSVLKAAFEGKLTADWREAHKNELEPASVLLERIKAERKKKLGNKYKELPPVETSELPELPKGWEWTRLEEITILITDGKHGDCQNQPDSGYYFLSAKDINNATINYQNARQITYQDFLEVHKRTDLKTGDLCMVNTGATIGKIATATSDARTVKTTFQKSVAIIKIVEGYVLAKYLELVLRKDVAQLLEMSKGSAVNNLLLSDLKIKHIPFAPLAEQNMIIQAIERLFSIADELETIVERSLKESERLRQSILKQAFEGKLVPQDPHDEPAEKLLERIKAEKAMSRNRATPPAVKTRK